MKKLLLSTLLLSGVLGISTAYSAESPAYGLEKTDIASYPLYAETANRPPLIMLMLGRDHSMYYEAYNDLTDLDEDGVIDNMFTPHVVYDGIFESNWCYKYDKEAGDKAFYMAVPALNKGSTNKPVYYCNGSYWSGNFLNYVTSSRMDIVKRILIGGQRFSNIDICRNQQTGYEGTYQGCFRNGQGFANVNIPMISRQYIPRDTHVWAKVYNQQDIDDRFPEKDYKLTMWVPSGELDGENAMFGNVGRNLIIVTENAVRNYGGIGSYLDLVKDRNNETKHVYVWDWVARESNNDHGALIIDNNTTSLNEPHTTNGHRRVTAHDFFLVVESCNKSTIKSNNAPMPARCREYSENKMNTIGLLQEFSKFSGSDAYFGLITASWNNAATSWNSTSQSGGDSQKPATLRSEIVDLTVNNTQIVQDTGEFVNGSLMAAINQLSLSVNENTVGSTSHTSVAWGDCAIYSGNDRTTPTKIAGGCRDWGNPLLPMIRLSYQYFSNQFKKSNGGADNVKLRMKRFLNDQSAIDYSYAKVTQKASPYERNVSDSKPKFDYCYRPVNFILTDENISMDYDHTSSIFNDADTIESRLKNGFDFIAKAEGDYFTGSKIFGEYTGTKRVRDYETIHSLKKVSDFSEVRGVSTLEPHLQGSLKGAALAAYIHNSSDAQINIKGSSDKVLPFEHFAVGMASYLPKFEVYARNGKKVIFVPFCKAPKFDRAVANSNASSVASSYGYDTEDAYTSNCAVADVFFVNSKTETVLNEQRLTGIEFRVTYEDNEAGSDFDMDAIFTYKVEADDDDPNLMNVSITGYYSDTYAAQLGAYSIFGTAGVITPNYNNCTSGTCSTSTTGYIVDDRTFYIDVMKVDQDNSGKGYKHYSLMHSNSDPFNEYNNVTGAKPGPYTLTSDDIDHHKVTVLRDGLKKGDKNPNNSDQDFNSHHYRCLNDDEVKSIEGKVFFRGTTVGGKGDNTFSVNHYDKFLTSFANECNSTVSRQFYVTGIDDKVGFFDSPLAYTAYYGSHYGEKGNYRSRISNNPNYFYVSNATKLASQISEALTRAVNAGTNSGTGIAFPSLDMSNEQTFVTATFDTTYWTSELHSNNYERTATSMGTTKGQSNIAKFDGHKIWIADKEGNLEELSTSSLKQDKHPLYNAIFRELDITECQDSKENEKYIISHYIDYLNGNSSWEYLGNEKSTTEDNTGLTAYHTCGQKEFYGFHARRDKDQIGSNTDYKLGAVINSTPQFFGEHKMIFAANDGMVHIGTVQTSTEDGATQVLITDSIIPYVSQETMPRNAKRRNNDFFLNDGLITLSKFKVGGEERLLAIGTLGVSHIGMYAIDLSHFGDRITKPNGMMLWELSPNYYRESPNERVRNLANLGAISAKINVLPYKEGDKTYLYAIFGNGYNSRDGVSGVAVVNALTGNVLTKDATTGDLIVDKSDVSWSTPNCFRSESGYKNLSLLEYEYDNETEEIKSTTVTNCYKNGMNQITAYDHNHDNIPDYIYSTDLYGNVFRINTYDGDDQVSPSSWVLNHIHTTVDPEFNVQSITTAPQLARDSRGYPMVIVASGKYLGKSDLITTDVQSIWAISDKKFNQASSSESGLIAINDDLTLAHYRGNENSKLYHFAMLAVNDISDCKLDYGDSFELKAGKRCRSNAYMGDLPPDYSIVYDAQFYDGWVMDLKGTNSNNNASERVYRNMIVLDRHLLVTSMIPGESECKGGGTSNFFDLNIWGADFYNNPNDSQTYSDNIYSEMTLAYDKRSTSEVTGTNTDSKASGIRNRNDAQYGCTTVIVGRGDSNNETEVNQVHQYCPHVKSWQRIYH